MTTLCYMNTCSCTFYLSQEGNVWIVHMIGAFLAFVFGGVYCCLQTYLSFKLPNIPGSTRNLRIGRLVICVLDFAFMVASILLRQQCVRPTKQNKKIIIHHIIHLIIIMKLVHFQYAEQFLRKLFGYNFFLLG